MIMNIVYFLSVLFVIFYIGFSVKPSPIYGGLALVISGGMGCSIILSYGGSFLGLMVFLVYLGGMMVVFGYTTAMAMERYPDSWVSNVVVWSVALVGVIMELLMAYGWFAYDGVEALVQLNSLGEWMVYDSDKGVGFLEDDPAGVATIYSYNCWLLFVGGWTLFAGIFIVIEITRGGWG